MTEATLRAVSQLHQHADNVVAELEEALELAKAGKIRSVALVYEQIDGTMGHSAAFGAFADRNATVGRLHVCAQHITLNELLEWKPSR